MKKYIMSFFEHVQFMEDQEKENKFEPVHNRSISKIPGADHLDQELNEKPLRQGEEIPEPKKEDDYNKNKNQPIQTFDNSSNS